jgi:hypothetical protein
MRPINAFTRSRRRELDLPKKTRPSRNKRERWQNCATGSLTVHKNSQTTQKCELSVDITKRVQRCRIREHWPSAVGVLFVRQNLVNDRAVQVLAGDDAIAGRDSDSECSAVLAGSVFRLSNSSKWSLGLGILPLI